MKEWHGLTYAFISGAYGITKQCVCHRKRRQYILRVIKIYIYIYIDWMHTIFVEHSRFTFSIEIGQNFDPEQVRGRVYKKVQKEIILKCKYVLAFVSDFNILGTCNSKCKGCLAQDLIVLPNERLLIIK